MSTRRKFLFDCSTAMTALALIPAGAVNLAALAGGVPVAPPLRYSALAAQVNTVFRVHLASGQVVPLKLLKAPLARPTPAALSRRLPGDAGHEKFSLIFSGPKEVPLASAIHQFEHRQLGRFEMHLGPIGAKNGAGVRYEAVFNQPMPAKSVRTTLT